MGGPDPDRGDGARWPARRRHDGALCHRRLASLEEIVDWQPFDRVAWRLAVPGVGPVAATADLDPTESGTRLRLRWAYEGSTAADAAAVQRMRGEKEAAYARLATVIAGALPVVQQEEARP